MKKYNDMKDFKQAINKIDKKKSLGKGILAQMEESTVLPYSSKITKESIEKAFNKIYTPLRKIVMYTGEAGMFNFQWALTFGEDIKIKNYKQKFKRIKGTYFSLFTKQGKYKLYVLGKTFTVYEGTKVIKVFSDVQSSHLMNFTVFDKPEIHKEKMIEINNYLKKLENGIK